MFRSLFFSAASRWWLYGPRLLHWIVFQYRDTFSAFLAGDHYQTVAEARYHYFFVYQDIAWRAGDAIVDDRSQINAGILLLKSCTDFSRWPHLVTCAGSSYVALTLFVARLLETLLRFNSIILWRPWSFCIWSVEKERGEARGGHKLCCYICITYLK